MGRDEPSRTLKEAYEREPRRAEPSDLLWERTRNALRERGALKASRPRTARWPAAALLAVASFAGGIFVGVGLDAQEAPTITPSEASAELAAERVQEAGTVYAATLESLVRSLDDATPEQIATGQQVIASASEAHEQAAALLFAGAVDRRSSEAPSTDEPLIWF